MRRAVLIAGLLAIASASLARPAPDRREVYSELLRADALAFRKAEREAPIVGVILEGEPLHDRFERHFLAFDLERSKLRTALARRLSLKHNDLRAIDAEGDVRGW